MTCIHLHKLYKLCQEHDLKLGGSDLIRVFCHQCGEQEVCPSTLMDEYDAKHAAGHRHQKEAGEGLHHVINLRDHNGTVPVESVKKLQYPSMSDTIFSRRVFLPC